MKKILFMILTTTILCSCTTQREMEKKQRMEEQQRMEAKQRQKEIEEEEERKAEEEKSKEFASDVNWILERTLNSGYNPGAKKLEPNSNKEPKEE